MADSVVAKLKIIHSNFSTGLYCVCLLRRLKRDDIAKRDRVIVGEDGLHCIPPGQQPASEAGDFYQVTISGTGELKIHRAAMEFAKMLLRNLTLDSYEAIRSYCEETHQLTELRAQGWYEFARMIRNSLTHAQRWHFRDYDRKRLPVSWRGKVIELSMDGKQPPFTFYDWWDGCELFQEMNKFAATLK